MKLKSVEEEWAGFSLVIFRGKPISKTQRDEMKKAFFAGALATFNFCGKIGTDEVSEKEGLNHLESVRDELTAFLKKIETEFREQN